MRSVFIAMVVAALFTACSSPERTASGSQGNNIMDKEKIISGVLEVQNRLISLYKQGAFMDALAVDLDSENFRCIKNGKIETYDELAARYKRMSPITR